MEQFSILIIDDDHDIRVSYREALETLKYTIHSATNGQDALILLSKITKLPDLIVLDMRMPLMGGEEFLKHKNQDERFKDIPVVIVSHHPKEKFGQWKLPYLMKPFDLKDFLGVVMSYVHKKKPSYI